MANRSWMGMEAKPTHNEIGPLLGKGTYINIVQVNTKKRSRKRQREKWRRKFQHMNDIHLCALLSFYYRGYKNKCNIMKMEMDSFCVGINGIV